MTVLSNNICFRDCSPALAGELQGATTARRAERVAREALAAEARVLALLRKGPPGGAEFHSKSHNEFAQYTHYSTLEIDGYCHIVRSMTGFESHPSLGHRILITMKRLFRYERSARGPLAADACVR